MGATPRDPNEPEKKTSEHRASEPRNVLSLTKRKPRSFKGMDSFEKCLAPIPKSWVIAVNTTRTKRKKSKDGINDQFSWNASNGYEWQ
jgi:hypothetical protein